MITLISYFPGSFASRLFSGYFSRRFRRCQELEFLRSQFRSGGRWPSCPGFETIPGREETDRNVLHFAHHRGNGLCRDRQDSGTVGIQLLALQLPERQDSGININFRVKQAFLFPLGTYRSKQVMKWLKLRGKFWQHKMKPKNWTAKVFLVNFATTKRAGK